MITSVTCAFLVSPTGLFYRIPPPFWKKPYNVYNGRCTGTVSDIYIYIHSWAIGLTFSILKHHGKCTTGKEALGCGLEPNIAQGTLQRTSKCSVLLYESGVASKKLDIWCSLSWPEMRRWQWEYFVNLEGDECSIVESLEVLPEQSIDRL